MWGWSLSFLRSAFDESGYLTLVGRGALVVASLNMLMNVTLSMLFGDKSVLKIRGRR